MKINIRKGLFETNSSSMHTIVVLNEDEHYDKKDIEEEMWLDNEGTMEIFSEGELDFGRHFDILITFVEKLKYAIAYYGKERFEEIEKIANKYVPECKRIDLPSEFLKAPFVDEDGNTYESFRVKEIYPSKEEFKNGEVTRFEVYKGNGKYIEVKPSISDEYRPYYGEIDHQSRTVLGDWFKKHPDVSLEEFLINKKYIIVIDGDESFVWDKYKAAKIINTDMIESEYNPIKEYYDKLDAAANGDKNE